MSASLADLSRRRAGAVNSSLRISWHPKKRDIVAASPFAQRQNFPVPRLGKSWELKNVASWCIMIIMWLISIENRRGLEKITLILLDYSETSEIKWHSDRPCWGNAWANA
jgi:hypothetical protein